MKKITLIITGSIAASKAIILLEKLKKNYEVKVICTKNALKFIKDKSFSYYSEFFEKDFYTKDDFIVHTELAKADMIVVYPATMDFISKANLAICDSLALGTFFASTSPKILFPAMNHNMYHYPKFQMNLKELTELNNIKIIKPNSGELACKVVGDGRLPEPDEALEQIDNFIIKNTSLKDKTILINNGRTRTYLDAIRYITNNSTGKMGHSLVKAFLDKGAKVILVEADTDEKIQLHKNLTIIPANTNENMLKAMEVQFDRSDIVIAVAALNDYKSSIIDDKKISKQENSTIDLQLVKNVDILKTLGEKKKKQLLIGFSAQNTFDIEIGKNKMKRKNCDGICINTIDAMGTNETKINFIFKDKYFELKGTKRSVSQEIVNILTNTSI